LARADAAQLPEILPGWTRGPLAANWIRTAVDAIANATPSNQPLPAAELEKFILSTATIRVGGGWRMNGCCGSIRRRKAG